jgi:hypothetical protein
MSWSVNAIGKPAAVAAKLAKDFVNVRCTEPEETIKNAVAMSLAAALAVYPPNWVVQVVANGSQHAPDMTKPDEKINGLYIKLDPVYGFIE